MPNPGEYLRLHPLLCNRCAKTKKKNAPSERTDRSSRKNTTKQQIVGRDSQPLDAQFKILVMLTELVEYGCKIRRKNEGYEKSNKGKCTGTGGKLRLKSMVWSRRKKETFNQNRMKKQEFKKMRRGLGTSGTNLNISIFES